MIRSEPWGAGFADEVEAWHYEPPYDFYDATSDPEDAEEMRDPAQSEHYRAVLGEDSQLEAFWWFDRNEDVVVVGIGLRPDLTGRGLGERFLLAQLDHARAEWEPRLFRLYVAAWNERARRLYERLGFHAVGREVRRFARLGEHEFVQMELAA